MVKTMKQTIPLVVLILSLAFSLTWGQPTLATKGDCPTGTQEMVCLAENGDAEAQYNLGLAYLYGDGIEEDRMQALKWLDRAAKQGHRLANNMLASMSLSNEPGDFCAK